MLETILKLFLEQLHPIVAIPLAIVIAALVMSIYGKTKSFFDAVLTIDNAIRSTRYFVGSVIVIHAAVGMAAAYCGYFHTDLFSPPVSQTLTHPLGRSYIRFTDWSVIFVEALLYLPLLLALSRDTPNARRATIAFVLAIIPTAIVVAFVASTYPALLAQGAIAKSW